MMYIEAHIYAQVATKICYADSKVLNFPSMDVFKVVESSYRGNLVKSVDIEAKTIYGNK